jgi:hypothetical protein
MFAAGIDYETRDGRVVLKEGGVLDVGTTLQVWWRSDKAFHAGTVQGYVADEGVHLIRYDGDESGEHQRVNLTQQHYQLTGVFQSADAAVADIGYLAPCPKPALPYRKRTNPCEAGCCFPMPFSLNEQQRKMGSLLGMERLVAALCAALTIKRKWLQRLPVTAVGLWRLRRAKLLGPVPFKSVNATPDTDSEYLLHLAAAPCATGGAVCAKTFASLRLQERHVAKVVRTHRPPVASLVLRSSEHAPTAEW